MPFNLKRLVAAGAPAALMCIASCGQASTTPAESQQTAVQRGEYLTTILACNDCHTPFKLGPNGPEPDMTRMLSGHPEGLQVTAPPQFPPDSPWGFAGTMTSTGWGGPWGVSFAANLTPDENTGLGIWTEDMFVRALRLGKHMGTSRTILPPMPWPMYAKMTDDDLKAIYAYLRTIPAISNRVPEPIPPAGPPGTH